MTVSENLMIALAIANNKGAEALSLMDTPELRRQLDGVLDRYSWGSQTQRLVLAQGVQLLDIAMAVVSKPAYFSWMSRQVASALRKSLILWTSSWVL